jgi:ribose-phosphate pyrophosphokinase
MKILNLTNLDTSDIKYHVSKFPDGQQNITINKENCYESNYGYLLMTHEDCKVTIKSRLNNFQDLELIVCATKSLRNLGVKEIHLYTPYFMGARSDRQFEEGGNRYLADVICPIINSLNFESVTVLDPHSYVLGNLINNFKSIDNSNLIEFAVRDILVHNSKAHIKDLVYIAPDAGASHKIFQSLKNANITDQNVIICSKERDNEGKLTRVNVPYQDTDFRNKDFIIIDDICDGGQTFINIAKHLNNGDFLTKPKIYLIVTHGIFSKDFGELSQYFDGIYCTNSYKDINDYITDPPFLVKQLNVF